MYNFPFPIPNQATLDILPKYLTTLPDSEKSGESAVNHTVITVGDRFSRSRE
ncbi:MAG: hypothetical protein F6K21_08035 [Symploca sp. SIO2D2]|nr:hypothetical protein [Symploca sp. SIO2D2]